ncbi:MAG TPA: hypothetical protein VLH56_19210 [Dissulfurispiraceae bacterium]|nr:hypothetical protein [Dissulfurispiraceae bacterium]
MADQTRQAAITALVSYLDTNVPTLNLVNDGALSVSQLAEDQYPACLIVEGKDYVSREITSTRDIILELGCIILYKGSNTSESAARTLEDLMIKEIEQSVLGLLSDTVMNIEVMPSDFPFAWPDVGTTHWRGRVIRIRYRQDF